MKKLPHTTLKYLLVVLFLTLHGLACDQRSSTAKLASKAIEKDTTEAFVVNWLEDTIPTGIPLQVKGQYYPADSFPEPAPVKGIKPPKAVPAYSNVTTVNIKPKIVQAPDPLRIITPGENSVPLPDTITVDITRTPVKQPKPVPAKEPSMRDNAEFDIQYLDTKHGLLSAQINGLLKDHNENLWFATDEGLSRYDGKYFTHYTINEGLPGGLILALFEDTKHNLWIEIKNNGIVKFDGHNFTHYDITTNWGGTRVSLGAFQEDQDGNIWIRGRDELYRYIGEGDATAKFIHYSKDLGLKFNQRPILIDQKGNIWIASSKGVIKFNGKSFTHFIVNEEPTHNNIICLMEDKRGRIWMGNERGLDIFQFDKQGKAVAIAKYDFENAVDLLIRDDNGDIWYSADNIVKVTCEKGRIEVNESGESLKVTKFNFLNGMSGHYGYAMEIDKKGNIWMGTLGGGIYRWDPNSFYDYTASDGLSTRVVSSIAEDVNGHLWFANEVLKNNIYEGVSRFDGRHFFHYTHEEGLGTPLVRRILKDSREQLWFVHMNGFTRYDGRSFYHYLRKYFKSNNSGYWMASQGKRI